MKDLRDPKEMNECIFCQIVSRKNKGALICYEDPEVLAIHDKYPLRLGHVVVISKKHSDKLTKLSAEEACFLGKSILLLSKAIEKATGCDNILIASFGGKVHHTHFHLIPFSEQDSDLKQRVDLMFLKRPQIPNKAIREAAERIISQLAEGRT